MTFAELSKKYWWGYLVIGVLVVGGFVFGIANSIQSTFNEGERREQDLTALYNTSLISLSTCLDQGRTAAQVTEQEYESLKEILVEVAGARYDSPSTASNVIGGGQLFSAVVEAYPQIDQRSWQNLQTVVVGCRDEFQGSQDRIQASAAEYNRWRVSNDVFNGWIKSQFPSNELKVVTAVGDTLYGQSAYDRITRVVSVEGASQAFETGDLGEQDLFGE